MNDHAPIYLHRSAFGPYYILSDDRDPAYIGLPLGLEEFRDRFIFTDREMVIDRELTLLQSRRRCLTGWPPAAACRPFWDSGCAPSPAA